MQTSQQRKKNSDKRDSVAQLSALGDGSPKRLRGEVSLPTNQGHFPLNLVTEKTSWLGMSRGYATTASSDGQWVRVRCTLAEMDGGRNGPQCRLTIIADKVCLLRL